MITIEELKNKIEDIGYIATEELLYDMFNALDTFSDEEINSGQDIFSICLEGPPGAGKTEFAKVYTKICNELFCGNVEMVDYQCDATTGKNELFEDINISSAIRHDADHVNIPGKLVEAIQKVNQGKKVILFIDEYDKAREETDAFFLQLLQSGKINAVQYGDLEIKEEYKTNLQVIFCKNDMREEVSGPLSRRMRILRLDYMTPENFYRVAYQKLIFEKQKQVDEGLLNLVTLMYEHAYDMRDLYKRLPACSEMLIAITDADRLLKKANAPQHVIYQVIIKNMFKSLDDQKTFESSFENQKEQKTEKLYDLIKQMKEKKEENQKVDINHLIALKIFNDQSAKFAKKMEEMQKLIEEYKEKFSMLEKRKEQTVEKEKQKILLENGSLISTNKPLKVMKNFEDESANIKRGYNIFEVSNQDWTDFATMKIPRLSHHFFLEKLMQYASNLEIKIYENGILLKEEGDQKVIVIQDFDENHEQRYRMLSNYPVIPSTAILDIENFLSFALETYQLQEKTVGQIEEDALESMGTYDLHALIYNDFPLELEEVKDHVYSMIRKDKIENLEELKKITNMFSCKEKDQAVFASKEILKGKCSLMNNTSLLFLEKQKQEWLKKYGLDSKSILSFRAKIKQATKEVQESLGEELLKLISKKSFQDDYEKALELIYRGANIEFKNEKKGDFPLLICARKNYMKTFFALIKAGANVNQTNNYLTTVTMASARHGNKEILQTLILLNADINARCLDGDNAIMSAKRHEQVECFQMLVNAQAYLNNQNLQNQTLFDLPGNIEINPFLLEDYSIPEPDPSVLLEEAQLKLIKIKNDR